MISERLAELLIPSTRVCVLTGAGVSAESGVPTFRDKNGLWQKFKPEELANMQAFLANPALVWEWYEHRRKVIREVRPNAGHLALARMEEFFSEFTLATQNVDGLHAAAGSTRLLELHGNIMRSYCVSCGEFATAAQLETLGTAGAGTRPICAACGGLLRPDVVWFGEMLPTDVMARAQAAAENCDLFFTVGTSAAVYPAAGLPLIAREAGAYVVEVNSQPTEISAYMDECLRGPSAQLLPQVVAASKVPGT